MAVTLRSTTTATKTSGSGLQLIINVPAGVQNGDVLVFFALAGSSANTPGLPAGLTSLDTEATGPSVRSAYRIASSEPASYSFSVSDSQGAIGVCFAYSGADGTTPINAHAAWHRTASTTTITADTITTNIDGCTLVWFGGCGNATGITAPAGYGNAVTVTQSGFYAKVVDKAQGTQGATGSVTGTSDTSTNTQGTLVAIAPPASATVVPTLGLLGVGT